MKKYLALGLACALMCAPLQASYKRTALNVTGIATLIAMLESARRAYLHRKLLREELAAQHGLNGTLNRGSRFAWNWGPFAKFFGKQRTSKPSTPPAQKGHTPLPEAAQHKLLEKPQRSTFWGGRWHELSKHPRTKKRNGTLMYDVKGDGACGSRCLALHAYGDEEKWSDVRKAMADTIRSVQETNTKHPLYTKILFTGASEIADAQFKDLTGINPRQHGGIPYTHVPLSKDLRDAAKKKRFTEKREAYARRIQRPARGFNSWALADDFAPYASLMKIPVYVYDGDWSPTVFGREFARKDAAPVKLHLIGSNHWNIAIGKP